MNPPPEPQPHRRRYSARHQARLDAETHATLAALTKTFHQKCAAILRFVMQWGLVYTTARTVDPSIPDRPQLVHMLVDPELLQQMQDAADAQAASVAAWVRHAMRHITPEDVPPSWRTGATAVRSHEPGYDGRRFQFPLNPDTQTKVGMLMQTFDQSAAEIIRQLMAQAGPADCPRRWHVSVGDPGQENDA
jgi:hypothetical protein